MDNYGVLHIDLGPDFRGGQRQVHYLARYLNRQGIASGCVVANGGALEARLSHEGITTFPIEYKGYDIIGESVRLRRVCSEMGYNIVHAHDSHGHNLALTMAFVNTDLRTVVTRRVLSERTKGALSGFKYRSASISKFIAVSSAVENELLSWGVPERRIVRIPSGVDLSWFKRIEYSDFLARHNIPEDKFCIGTACAMDDNKDVETLINAASKLSYDRDDFILVVAGDGKRRGDIERLVEFIEAGRMVRLVGHIRNMPEFYSALDIYVLSSRSEGLGTSVLEAAACGAIPVVSDCGGPTDYVEHGRNGFVFPIEDDEALYHILGDVLEREDLRTRLRAQLPQMVKPYDIDNVCGQIVDCYSHVALSM